MSTASLPLTPIPREPFWILSRENGCGLQKADDHPGTRAKRHVDLSRRLSSAQQCVHPRGYLPPLLRQDVRVDIQSGADLREDEVLLDQFGVEPLGQEQRRARMPQVMEAHGSKARICLNRWLRTDLLRGCPLSVVNTSPHHSPHFGPAGSLSAA